MGVFKSTGTTTALIDACKRHITRGTLLDLGCGCGVIGTYFPDCYIHASDISQEAVDYVKQTYPFMDVRQGNLFSPWQGMTFDYIIDDVSGISEEIARVSPWFQGVPCDSGRDGANLVCDMLIQAPKYLAKKGKLFFPILSLSNEERIKNLAEYIYKIELLSHTEFPIPKELYDHTKLLYKLKDEGHIDFKERFGCIVFWTDIYKAELK